MHLINQQEFRKSLLASYGASVSQIEELLAYNQNVFKPSYLTHSVKFPLPPEVHVTAWEKYTITAKKVGAFESLKRVLVQLQFPIQEGISQTEAYRLATRKGVPVDGVTEATGLVLKQPEKLQLRLHQSLAGAIPVLFTENREDFVSLVQALFMRNEPKPIPASMGACIVSGFNNWDRIRQYRQQWEAQQGDDCSETKWAAEFQRIIPHRELYQDQFIILSSGFYSNVPASDMKLSQAQWQQLSLTIRLEHECTHYFTRRLFSSMRNNLLDELIADYRGIVAAIGYYRADWFLRFLGLESFPLIREEARLQNYRGQPSLSDGAFKILQSIIKAAAENLEYFDASHANELKTANNQLLMLLALTDLTLEELAATQGRYYLQNSIEQWQKILCS